MKKILVTGGAGFVGRRLCHALLEQGHTVICVDNIQRYTGGISPENGWPLFNPFDYKNFTFLKEDCRNFFAKNLDTDFDYVYHLAAMVGGRLMIEYNPLAVAEDLSIDAECWAWAKKTSPKKVVCFSSSAAYPISLQAYNNYSLLKEDMISFSGDIGMPDMSYGWAKLTHEYLARLAYEHHGIKSVIYRPFSGYGEDQDLAYPFPSIIKRALEHNPKDIFQVWGSGEQMRDFIYIDDCVSGILSTVDLIDNADALNLSTGIFASFKTFAQLACKKLGFSVVVKGSSDKPEGVFARGGCTKKQKSYGFTASTDFEKGIEIAMNYFTRKKWK